MVENWVLATEHLKPGRTRSNGDDGDVASGDLTDVEKQPICRRLSYVSLSKVANLIPSG